jgi:LmbE family N-acetylglucosaminyl deacetylase
MGSEISPEPLKAGALPLSHGVSWPLSSPASAGKRLEDRSAPADQESAPEDRLHLYLSPHFDDAILSCGGLIYAQCQAVERAGVLTLCAALPDPDALSPLARRYETEWSNASGGVASRREENAAALSAWGVSSWEGGAADAIYRNRLGAPYYATRQELFGEPDPEDAAAVLTVWERQVKQIAREHGHAVLLYAPLGVGGHVDHELARRLAQLMAEAGCEVRFYEDYPYAELTPGGVREAMARFGLGPHAWTCHTVAIDVRAKIEAIEQYRSQLGRVFGCEKDLIRRVSEFTAGTACAFSARERMRRRLAPSGLRLRLWRRSLGYHAHAERIWRLT